MFCDCIAGRPSDSSSVIDLLRKENSDLRASLLAYEACRLFLHAGLISVVVLVIGHRKYGQ